MKLISMTDFVIQNQKNTQSSAHSFFICVQYANFLKEPLELGMFVPCDRNGNVLDAEPCSLGMFEKENPFYDVYLESKKEWDEAKERCLFDGFYILEEQFIHNLIHYFVKNKKMNVGVFWNFNDKWELYDKFKTVEDLVKYDLQLTQTSQKQIGL